VFNNAKIAENMADCKYLRDKFKICQQVKNRCMRMEALKCGYENEFNDLSLRRYNLRDKY
jgi:hypothetical protein